MAPTMPSDSRRCTGSSDDMVHWDVGSRQRFREESEVLSLLTCFTEAEPRACEGSLRSERQHQDGRQDELHRAWIANLTRFGEPF